MPGLQAGCTSNGISSTATAAALAHNATFNTSPMLANSCLDSLLGAEKCKMASKSGKRREAEPGNPNGAFGH
jgi:hypothetical protein